jgi:RNA polymerase sigma factor (sigma-70 family)
MNELNDEVSRAVNDLYKSHYGKIVSTMLNYFEGIGLETVEDLVQESFAAALVKWTAETIPSNPAGWVFTVCRNKAITMLKREKRWGSPPELVDNGPEYREPVIRDEQLKLLFACAHPDLSPKVQVVITLKYVANLKGEAIARALGMTIDGIEKLLMRARKKIRDERILLPEPGLASLNERLPTVHKIIYLIFNEGYHPASGDEILNEELCEEALILTKELLDHELGDHATMALYALMLFNAARFKGRTGSPGELLDLDQQDRSLWDRPMISLAMDYLRRSRQQALTSYHYEAAIAWLHCTADSFAATNWLLISKLYLRLLQMNPNPFVELNYAIASYFAGRKTKAFQLLDELSQQPFLNQYYLLNAALGKLYLLEGEPVKAKKFLTRTLEQTNHPLEIAFIRRLMEKIKD